MADFGVVRRVILPVVLLGLTAAGLVNTYGDSTGVEQAAARAACGGEPCPAQMREFTRSPFSHEYVFEVGKSGTRTEVRCQRSAIFFGDYSCAKK
ncbi:MAG TPA: hypothetical protein VHC69_02050 [Polyangiaceae bacterium]|nr:hypothetical protein [Polyangiaceae bacterium]